MQVKQKLRAQYRERRANIADKTVKDELIAGRLFELPCYKSANTMLCYVSFGSEINTDSIINRALEDGKTVAVPYCNNKQGDMEFYIINSPDNLKPGTYGILEPDINSCKRLEDFEKSIIIVPGLSFDNEGYRIGYGGGYYDRFLAKHSIKSVGLCYSELLNDKLPRESFDLPIDILITENNTHCINGGEYGL